MLDMIGQASINSLVIAMSLFLVAAGLSLVYGILLIINFSHGEIFMMGSYMFWLVSTQLGLHPALAVVGAILFSMLLSGLIQIGPFNRIKKEPSMGFIVALGLVYVLQTVAQIAFGLDSKTVQSFPGFTEAIKIGNIAIGGQRFLIIIVGVVVLIGLNLFMKYHRWGKGMQALVQNPEAAELQGISVFKGSLYAMLIGGALAGLAGGLIAPISYIDAFIGSSFVLKAFAAIIIGGLGSFTGTIVGCLIWGFVEGFTGTFLDSTIGFIIMYIFVIVLIIFKPNGIMGRKVE
ncbi:MAG: branched-chain amino acid ABC transporter permease [Actinomycetota bacterium]